MTIKLLASIAAFGIVFPLGRSTMLHAEETMAQSASDSLIAIDVLLEPDRKMMAKAGALNATLRGNYPSGYSLDATHAPHVTLLQAFVRTKDFDAVTSAVRKVLAVERLADLRLKARGLDYAMWSGVAVTLIVIERTPELMRLERKVDDAVRPFSVSGGTSAAFVDTPPDAEIIGYVETFVPKSSGANYQPHVTAGVASEAFVKQLKARPFEPFTFRPAGAAIYQLGNFGTASRKLWQAPADAPRSDGGKPPADFRLSLKMTAFRRSHLNHIAATARGNGPRRLHCITSDPRDDVVQMDDNADVVRYDSDLLTHQRSPVS